ncbi:MAG: xanthine dehydrogenase family protein molybdopterin-binding subunit [Candidatus Tectimicrobiota bacterium]
MSSSVIGQPVTRIDGRLKVTGSAAYAVEHALPQVAYGVGVTSTIAKGRIVSLDTTRAAQMPGVLAILHHGNSASLYRPAGPLGEQSRAGESRPPFEDEQIYYYGQFVALVIADTFEQAQDAAAQVQVAYESAAPALHLESAPLPDGPPQAQYQRGDAVAALQQAAVQLDVTYTTPVETHNPMEMHGTIASWDNGKLTLYETTQGVVNHHNVAAQMLNLPLQAITIISPFVGSGFGSKLFPWPHSWLAALGARQVGRPVKVTVPRTLMFTTVGHRPRTRHRLRLGAKPDGQLVAIMHDVLQHTSMLDAYLEDCVEPTAMLYSCPHISAVQHVVPLNVGTPTPMRGPGRTPALFALESALDELAVKLALDPVELRLRNHAEQDESTQKPWSSKHLREAYRVGAERFGWSKRTPQVGSMRRDQEILGWGMATCTWPTEQKEADVRVRLLTDGSAQAACATQDIGTGTYTVFAEVVADRTGIPLERIQVHLGDSTLPPGPTSGGSAATASVLPAILQATDKAVSALLKAATKAEGSPFARVDPQTLMLSQGRVHLKNSAAASGVPFQQILAMQKLSGLEGRAQTELEASQKASAIHSFGAHFCEVAFDPDLVLLRVTRWLTVIDGGQMINQKAARNQIIGSVVMGIGMGLLEETVYDSRTGHPVNNNYADYLVALQTDVPDIECIFLDYPDPIVNVYGARGIGEIGLTGCAAALTAATYHATGIRVRELPIRLEKLLS